MKALFSVLNADNLNLAWIIKYCHQVCQLDEHCGKEQVSWFLF